MAKLTHQIGDVEAAVGMNAIELMELVGKPRMISKQFREGSRLAVHVHSDAVQKIGLQSPGAPKDAGLGSSSVDDRLPFALQEGK